MKKIFYIKQLPLPCALVCESIFICLNIDDIPSKIQPLIKITKGVLITCLLHINYKENQCQTAYLSTVYSLCNPFSFEKLCFVTRYYLESYVLQPDII